MSNSENDKLMERFLDECEKIIICPYCGKDNQLDPPKECCGEVHAEWGYYNKVLDYNFTKDEAQEAYLSWQVQRGEA